MLEELARVEALGGEGLMLRGKNSAYINGRSGQCLKVKTFHDAEAKVIAHEPGKGKYTGQTGALRCVMGSGKEFRVGSGLSDADRAHPPALGAIIVYRYQELTPDGVPRFPSYVGVRVDGVHRDPD
jgi:DNA ligase-1